MHASTRSSPWCVARSVRPLLAFAAVQAALAIAAQATGYRYFSAVSWSRFDSGFYASIARAGYSLGPCVGLLKHSGGMCGNSGWLPAYPLTVSPFIQIGLPPLSTALFVSLGFTLAGLAVVWNGFLDARLSWANA